MIDRTKRFVELAHDVGSRRVRVFGNNIPTGVRRDECVQYVAESLRGLGEFASEYGVDVLLEMHGQFNYWGFARTAVELANHPRVALVYNCDRKDLVAGSVAATYSQVRRHVRHVHLHELTDGFPYPELFELLRADGYDGYLSSEIEAADALSREQYFATYAALVRAWSGQPFYAMPR
jgi:sugar phosphate isomerase/epimerase